MAKKGSQLTVRTATEIQGGEFVILGYAGKSYQMTLDELKKFIGIIEEGGGSVDLTQVSTDILPLADASKDIGSLEKRWKKIYSTAITVKAQSVDEEEVNIHDGGIEGKIGQDIQWSIDGSGNATFLSLKVSGADVATMQYVNNELSKYVTTDTLTKNYVSNTSLTEILKKYYESGYVDFLLSSKASTGDLNKTNAQLGIVQTDVATLKSYFQDTDDVDDIINKWRELEAFLAGQTETSTLADLLSVKANKATTLAGYDITDAKIVDGVITLGNSTITPLLKGSAYPYTRAENLAINKTAVADRWYAVYLSQKGELLVNIPWANDIYTDDMAKAALSDTLNGYVTTLAFQDYAKQIQQNSTNIKNLTKTVDEIYEDYVTLDKIPTKTSQLTNDSNFLTSQSLDGLLEDYAKKSGYSALKVLATDSSGNIVAHYVSTDKLGFLSNVTSDIQAQINALSIPDLDGYVTTETLTTSLNNLADTYLSFRGGGTVSGATTFSGGLSVQNSLTLLGVNVAAGSSGLTFGGKIPMYSGDAYTKNEADKAFHPLTTVDTAPTLNSSNLVTSGGVAKAVADLAESADGLYQRKGSYLTASSTLSSAKLDKNTITIVSTPVALGESITKNQLISNLGLKGLAFKDSIEITSANVTGALGYTPYNAANFTKANIKSTLGISNWALASSKPTYTAAEVGALPSSTVIPSKGMVTGWGFVTADDVAAELENFLSLDGGTITGTEDVLKLKNSSGGEIGLKFDRAPKTSWYIYAKGGNLYFRELLSSEDRLILLEKSQGGKIQIKGNIDIKGTITNGTWNGDKIANAYLANNSITIAGTSVSLGGSITQNQLISLAGVAAVDAKFANYLPLSGGTISGDLRLKQYLRINALEGYGTGSCDAWYNGNNGTLYMSASNIRLGSSSSIVIHAGNISSYAVTSSNLESTLSGYPLANGTRATGTWGIDISGTAAAATKLSTARIIWGQSFDGSGDVGGNLSLGNNVIYGNNNTILIDATGGGLSFGYGLRNSSSIYYWGNSHQFVIGDTTNVIINSSGNVGIGTTNPNTKLHVAGGAKIEGALSTYGITATTTAATDAAFTHYVGSTKLWWVSSYNNCANFNTALYVQSGSTPFKVATVNDLSSYLPKAGGTISNPNFRSQLTIERSGSAKDSVIAFNNNKGLLGSLGCRGADGIPCVWLGSRGEGVEIIHAENISSYALPKAGGKISGSLTFSATSGSHIIGNANNVLQLLPGTGSAPVLPIKIAKLSSGRHSIYCDEDQAYDLGTSSYSYYYVYSRYSSASSDATKKNIIGNIPLTTAQIANAPAVSFTWKDSGEKSHGTIAQYWKEILPEFVSGDEGSYGLNYAALGVVSSIILARNIETHEQRIARLEKEISDLQKELNALVNNE